MISFPYDKATFPERFSELSSVVEKCELCSLSPTSHMVFRHGDMAYVYFTCEGHLQEIANSPEKKVGIHG